jgi:hypothetical protein
VILCELDGLPRQAAARQLGIPEGTLSSRLARAKDLLRHRLARRGLAPAAVAIEAVAHEARAVILPPSLAISTIEAAARVAAGASLAEAVGASVVTLTQGALNAMLLTKVKGVTIAMAAATIVTAGAVLAQPGPQDRDPFRDDGSPSARVRDPSRQDGGAAAKDYYPPAARSQQDRLGAVERKLDRILEALGGARRDDRREASPFEDDRPAMKSSHDKTAGPTKAGASPGQPSGMAPPAGYGGMMSSMMQDQMHGQMEQMRGMMGGGMRGQSPIMIETRVAELERRLDDLERRFGRMERRLSEADRPDAGSDADRGRPRFEAQKK